MVLQCSDIQPSGTTWCQHWFEIVMLPLTLVVAFSYYAGTVLSLPYRAPRLGTLIFFLLLFLFISEIARSQDSSFYEHVPEYLRMNVCFESTFKTLVVTLIFLTVPLFRYLNTATLEEKSPFQLAKKKEQAEVHQREEHRDESAQGETHSMSEKSALALAFSLDIELLSFIGSSHPIVLCCCRRRKLRSLREDVHRTLSVAARWGSSELSYVIVRANIARLLCFGHRKTISMLRNKTDKISVDAKAVILNAMQKNPELLNNDAMQEWVVELLMSEKGTNLMILKNICDGGGDYHTLHKLIFEDVRKPGLRKDVLTHFEQHAATRPEDAGTAIKVVSDIDDTFLCSGGHFPAGCDKRWPAKTNYPGVLQLFMELDSQVKYAKSMPKAWLRKRKDHNSVDDALSLDSFLCNLVFVSARPHVYKDYSERVTFRMFKQLRDDGQLHAMPTLIPGWLSSSTCATIKAILHLPNAWWSMGMQKFSSLKDFRQLYPAYALIFFGDNGQGDLIAAELARMATPPLIQAAFIHLVQPIENTNTTLGSLTAEARAAKWEQLGIMFVSSPVEAAVKARDKGFIGDESLLRVCDSAVEDLEALAIRLPDFPHWEERTEELNETLRNVRIEGSEVPMLDKYSLFKELKALKGAKRHSSVFSQPPGRGIGMPLPSGFAGSEAAVPLQRSD